MADLDTPFTRISNEIVEALARTNLSAYETRVLWVIFRKTYGYQKKEDWISVSQIAEMTGMHKAHISRAKSLLIAQNIVTERGNKVGFNKYWQQWKKLPKGVKSHNKVTPIGNVTERGNKPVTERGNEGTPKGVTPVTERGNSELPKGAYTKENVTKEENLHKKGTETKKAETTTAKPQRPFAEVEIDFRKAAAEITDEHYADKTINQARQLTPDYRVTYEKKVRVCVTSYFSKSESTKVFAKKVFHEIAGFVNDFGDMQKRLTDKEIAKRKQFDREDIGQVSDDDVNSFL